MCVECALIGAWIGRKVSRGEETEVHANERVNEAAARSLVRNQCRTLDPLFRELQRFCDITERRYM